MEKWASGWVFHNSRDKGFFFPFFTSFFKFNFILFFQILQSIPEEKEKEVINKIRSSTKTRTTTVLCFFLFFIPHCDLSFSLLFQDTETMTFKDGVLVNCSNPSLLQNVIFPPWRCHNFSYI